jgi:hypothetical protein
MQPMYYVGLDVQKRTISSCVKDGSGAIHSDAKLFEALAANRISTRRAATLAYIGHLLLQAYSGLKAEARMTALQGAKDLHMLLKVKYGPPLRKEAQERVAKSLNEDMK